MKLPETYSYLTDNHSLYIDSLVSNTLDNYTVVFLFIIAGIGILISFTSFLLGENPAGILLLAFSILLGGGNLVYSLTLDTEINTEQYETILKNFRKNLDVEMTKDQTDLPKKELNYTSFTVIERINESKNPIFDLTITIDKDTIIKRVKVVNTDNPNLIGKYRELPDSIQLDKEPFIRYDGFLFVKDIAEFEEQPNEAN